MMRIYRYTAKLLVTELNRFKGFANVRCVNGPNTINRIDAETRDAVQNYKNLRGDSQRRRAIKISNLLGELESCLVCIRPPIRDDSATRKRGFV